MDFSFPNLLLDLVQSGEVSESRIDFSVAKILQLKKLVGLLDNPFPDKNSKWIATVGSAQDRETSLQIARESITLLKNDRNVLPLPLSHTDTSSSAVVIQQILVTGPSANSLTNQNGGWTIHWQGAVNDTEFAPYHGRYTLTSFVLNHLKKLTVNISFSHFLIHSEIHSLSFSLLSLTLLVIFLLILLSKYNLLWRERRYP